MKNTNAIDGLLIDGQLTIETKDITNSLSPLPMTTFITTALNYSFDQVGGFRINFYINKGFSSERQLSIGFRTGYDPRITHYAETFTKNTATEDKHFYDFQIIEDTSTIETMKISPNKNLHNIDLKLRVESRENEIRELTGKGHIVITQILLAL